MNNIKTSAVVALVSRILLGTVLAVVGAFWARSSFWQDNQIILSSQGKALVVVVFAITGVFLPDLAGLAARAGIRQLAEIIGAQVASRIPNLPPPHMPAMPFGGRTKNNEKKKETEYKNPSVVDTSALIDARILEVAKVGFLTGTLLVPKLVLLELQHIADSADTIRRLRGRRGLDCLAELKKIKTLKVRVLSDQDTTKPVDEQLVALAQKTKSALLTTDFNLNKVASVSGVRVLNINELANAVKTSVLPGEELTIKIIDTGREKEQGVGYLPDGTMVVVEKGKALVGREVVVIVSRLLQTAAGRMIFGKLK